MQTTNKSVQALFRVLMGLAASLAATSQSQAQQYYYYPTTVAAPAQPLYYYTQPAVASQGYYTQQYVQPTYAAQPAQYYYAPQAYQPAPQVVATDGGQVYQTAYTTAVDTTTAQPPQASAGYGSDPYGFMAWLNSTRASYGLGPVNYDANLTNWAAMNNSQQQAQGLGHFVMGPARRQNSAMGGAFPGAMWMASPAHRAALLDPTISWFGIAAAGAYWTFNAY
jgi:uncharacterized protein YkwD